MSRINACLVFHIWPLRTSEARSEHYDMAVLAFWSMAYPKQ